MMLVLLVSTAVTRFALADRVRHPRVLIVFGGLVTIGVAAAFSYRGSSFLFDLFNWGDALSPEFVLLLALAALWWRGILIGRSQALVEESLEQTFFTGVGVLRSTIVLQSSHAVSGSARFADNGHGVFRSLHWAR